MAILGIIVLILSQALIYSVKIWQQGESNKEKFSSIRAVSNFIASEFRSLVLPIDRTSQSSLQFLINPPNVSSSYKNRDCFFWQAPLASNQTLGDIAEIGYFVKWDISKPQNPRSFLGRFFVNPSDSRKSGESRISPNFLIYNSPENWIFDYVIDTVAPGNLANDYKGLFVENIVGMWIIPLDPDGKIISPTHEFDSRKGYTYTDTRASFQTVAVKKYVPAAIDLHLAFMDRQTAAQIRPQEQATIIQAAHQASNGNEFMNIIYNNKTIKHISGGFQICSTKIYIPASK